MKNVFMFSGQGTQYFHMGTELRKHSPRFEHNIIQLSHIVKEVSNCDICNVIYDLQKRKSDNFSDPRLSNIALITIQYALVQTLNDEGIVADYVCGMSLGEYISAIVTGAISFDNAVQLAANAGICFNNTCDPGAMLAILDNSSIYYDHPELNNSTEIAFDSHDKHFVIAGFKDEINHAVNYLHHSNISFQILPVAFGYHSNNIDPACTAFSDIFSNITFSTPQLPVFSSVDGRNVEYFDGKHFWRTARDPICFLEAVNAISEKDNCRFIDIGPTGTMASLMRYSHIQKNQSKIFSIITPFSDGHINLEKLINDAKLELPFKTVQTNNKISAKIHHPTQAWVFPGQGSHHQGMGADLFKYYPELVAKADDVLGYSIEALCIDNPQSNLNKTQFTQPALYVVNTLHYLHRIKQSNPPLYLAGHSLGEYSALYASGAFDFETGLRLVQQRGTLMSQAQNGGMAAVIGLTESQVKEIIAYNDLQQLVIANINSPSQHVISGPKSGIIAAQKYFNEIACASYIPLQVSGAFHSPLMEMAAKEFAGFVSNMEFSPLNIPVISNVTARPYQNTDIANSLINQITHSVRWTDTLNYLFQHNVSVIKEVGPGSVLTKLVKAFCAVNKSFGNNIQHKPYDHKESA